MYRFDEIINKNSRKRTMFDNFKNRKQNRKKQMCII